MFEGEGELAAHLLTIQGSGSHLAAIAPVDLVTIVLLGVVGGCDHDASSTALHNTALVTRGFCKTHDTQTQMVASW